jgi:hypothetical protein
MLYLEGVRVGEQVNLKAELGAEVLVGRDVVLAHADDLDTSSLEDIARCSEGLALDRAALRVVFGINIDYQPFASTRHRQGIA